MCICDFDLHLFYPGDIQNRLKTNFQKSGVAHGWTLSPDIQMRCKIHAYPHDHKVKCSGGAWTRVAKQPKVIFLIAHNVQRISWTIKSYKRLFEFFSDCILKSCNILGLSLTNQSIIHKPRFLRISSLFLCLCNYIYYLNKYIRFAN